VSEDEDEEEETDQEMKKIMSCLAGRAGESGRLSGLARLSESKSDDTLQYPPGYVDKAGECAGCLNWLEAGPVGKLVADFITQEDCILSCRQAGGR